MEKNSNDLNSYFGSDDIGSFKSEFSGQKKDFDPDAYDEMHGQDPEDLEYENVSEGETDDTITATGSDIATAKLGLTIIDDTRAVMASMYSGHDKDRYRFYRNISDNDPVLVAAAQVVRKHQLALSPEWILGIALLTSTVYIGSMAHKDKKHSEEADRKTRKNKATAKATDSTAIKPIE